MPNRLQVGKVLVMDADFFFDVVASKLLEQGKAFAGVLSVSVRDTRDGALDFSSGQDSPKTNPDADLNLVIDDSDLQAVLQGKAGEGILSRIRLETHKGGGVFRKIADALTPRPSEKKSGATRELGRSEGGEGKRYVLLARSGAALRANPPPGKGGAAPAPPRASAVAPAPSRAAATDPAGFAVQNLAGWLLDLAEMAEQALGEDGQNDNLLVENGEAFRLEDDDNKSFLGRVAEQP